MWNAVVVVSVALFGVSSGAVLGARARHVRRFPVIPDVADIALLAAVLAVAFTMHLRVWNHWLHLFAWVVITLGCGMIVQLLKPRPQFTHKLTQ